MCTVLRRACAMPDPPRPGALPSTVPATTTTKSLLASGYRLAPRRSPRLRPRPLPRRPPPGSTRHPCELKVVRVGDREFFLAGGDGEAIYLTREAGQGVEGKSSLSRRVSQLQEETRSGERPLDSRPTRDP